MKKYIVVHSGARDLYEVAIALYKNDALGYLVTDDILLRKEYKNLFPKSKIRISLGGFIFRVLCQFTHISKFHGLKDYFLGRTAGRLSRQKKMPLLAYSGYAYYAFSRTTESPKILFQFHPHCVTNKAIFDEELKKYPEISKNLLLEEEYQISPRKIKHFIDEVRLADGYIAASSFTKQSLINIGANPEKITVAPYGVDLSNYPYVQRKIKKDEPLSFVFVGNYTQRKGIHYMLLACKTLQDAGYHFNIKMTGRDKLDLDYLNSFGLKNLSINYKLSHSELIDLLHSSDVFLFPSLCEGFAFVIIEAMSTGLPIISTTRTAGNDIVKNGIEGFTIEPSNVEEIVEKMKYFIQNPSECIRMGNNAAQTAKLLTWDNFETKVIEAVTKTETYFQS